MSQPVKWGFFDTTNKVFYQVDSQAEYERCLVFYRQMLQEEEQRRSTEAISTLDDLTDLVSDLLYSEPNPCFPELHEYEF